MIPKEIVKKLVGDGVYIYIKGITKEFGGIVESITSDEILVLKDKNNNLSYIPLDEIDIITERR
ncbi:MAG: DUF6897 domain-containing protein [Promethearchaeota archaeon]